MPVRKKKNYRHVVQAVYSTPWAITQERLATILDVLDARAAGVRLTEAELRAQFRSLHDDDLLDDDAVPSYSLNAAGVAVLPLQGVISQRMNLFMRISGGTSTEQFGALFDRALADPACKAIVLDINSPGGNVGGVAELAAKIAAARGSGKPIVAVANTQMCSAAYWIGAAADRVYASPSAMVGSIGVLMVHAEASAADAKAGIKRTVIQSGRYKAVGNSAEPLTAESKGRLQLLADSCYALFVEAVAKYRKTSIERVVTGMCQGDVAIGRDAVAEGLADDVASLEEVIVSLSAKLSAPAVGVRATTNDSTNLLGVSTMPAEIKAMLIAKGLCAADASDPAAYVALAKFYAARNALVPSDLAAIKADLTAHVPDALGPSGAPPAEHAAIAARARAEERLRASTIRATCRTLNIAEDRATEFADLGLSAEATNAHLIQFVAHRDQGLGVPDRLGRQGPSRLSAGDSFTDKFFSAAAEGLDARCLSIAANDGGSAMRASSTLSPGGSQIAGMRLMEIAAESLRAQGIETRGMAPVRIAALALASDRPDILAAQGASGTAYYETGSFANLTLNSARKVLMRGYIEAPVTFRVWCRIGEPVVDFKVNSIVKFGEASDLENQPEGDETPTDTGLRDDREYFVVETFARKTSFTRQMILNDDLSALSRLPMKQGIAAARTFNKLAYDCLAKNRAMADGNNLFDATHHQGNLLTGVTPPSIVELNRMQGVLRKMHGLNTDSYLNNPMRWLIVPAELEALSDQILRSQTDPANPNPNVKNPYYGRVEPVVEAYLSSYSAVTYYGAVDCNLVDTIEVRFLQGEETPYLESWWDVDKDVRYFKVRQTGTALAVDYRGLVEEQGS